MNHGIDKIISVIELLKIKAQTIKQLEKSKSQPEEYIQYLKEDLQALAAQITTDKGVIEKKETSISQCLEGSVGNNGC